MIEKKTKTFTTKDFMKAHKQVEKLVAKAFPTYKRSVKKYTIDKCLNYDNKKDRYFILGQIAALNYFLATIKPQRMDIKNIYIRSIAYIASELDRLYDMLVDGEMRYRVWNGGNR